MKLIPYRGDYIVAEQVSPSGDLVLKFGEFKERYSGYSEREAVQRFKQHYRERHSGRSGYRRGQQVVLRHDDIDRHGAGCPCGACNFNGKSYGVGIYLASDLDGDVLLRFYAASEESALHNARMACERRGYIVVEPEE